MVEVTLRVTSNLIFFVVYYFSCCITYQILHIFFNKKISLLSDLPGDPELMFREADRVGLT